MEFLTSIFFSVDYVTQAILALLGILLIFGFAAQIWYLLQNYNNLRQFERFVNELVSAEYVSSNRDSKVEQDWIQQNLYLVQVENELVAAKVNGRYGCSGSMHSSLINVPSSRARNLPALLTSVGVAGTFLGITIGLSEFNFNGIEQGTASLLTSASLLLDGMKTAFYTSLAGLAGSAFLMASTLIFSTILRYKTEKINTKLNGVLTHKTGIDYLRQIAEREQDFKIMEAQQRSAEIMQNVGNELMEFMNGFRSIGDNLNADAISHSISTALEKTMHNSLIPVLTAFTEELEVIRKIKQEDQEATYKGVINAIREELIVPVSSELHEVSKAVRESSSVTNTLVKNVEDVLSQMSSTVETIDNFNQNTMEKLQQFSLSLSNVLDGFKEDTKGTMQQITEKVGEVLKLSEKGMEAQRSAFELSANEVSNAFKGLTATMNEALDSRASKENDMFTATEKRINELLSQTRDGLNAQRVAFEESASRAADSFNEMGEQLAVSLENRSKSEKELFEETEKRIKSLLSKTAEELELQRSSFEMNSEKAAKAFENMGIKLEEALNKRASTEAELFAATENRIENLLERTTKSFEEQNSVLKNTGIEASSLMHSAKRELEQGLGDIDNKVVNMSKTVQAELESFRTQYQLNLTNFFNDQNNLLEDTLGKQANNLIDVVDRFKMVFESEYQTRNDLLKELSAQHEHLQQSAKTIEQLAKAIGLTATGSFSELQDIAHTMGRHIGELKRDYEHASRVFKEITEGLPQAMDEYFKRANSSTEIFFNEFDKAASQIHNRLSQAADFLVDARLTELEQNTAEVL